MLSSASKLDYINRSVYSYVPVQWQVKPSAVPDPRLDQTHQRTHFPWIWVLCYTDTAAFQFIIGLWDLTYLWTVYTCKMSVKTTITAVWINISANMIYCDLQEPQREES